jgi:hypothetical protein
MSNNDEKLEIEVEDDAPEVVKTEKEVEVEAKQELEPDDGIKDLKMRLEHERMARAEAEKQAQMAREQAYYASNEVHDTNLQLVKNAIETVKGNNEVLKRAYSEALSVGDYGKTAEIQEALSLNAARLMELERGRSAMEQAPKPQRPEPVNPVEALASQLSPRSAEWIRKNPSCVTDPRMYQKMVAAHNLALADGMQPDTDDYFSFVEDTLKINRRPPAAKQEVESDDDATSSAAKAVQRRTAPPAAPVTRAGNASGQRPGTVRLTRAEAETARDLGMTEEEYARNKMLLQKEGRL